ncbi:hypothetical protein D9M71_402290 [compost metagenome]
MRLLPGNEGDSASPTMKRSTNITTTATETLYQPTVACRMVKVDQRKMLQAYTRLGPKRSSSQPPGIWPST